MDGELTEYTAPVGSIKIGRLILTSSVRGVRLMACHSIGNLYRASFRGLQPVLDQEDVVITIQTTAPLLQERNPLDGPKIHICLSRAVSWEIEFRGRVENLRGDLRDICLRSMDILGDARQMELFLSRPQSAAFLYISGGIRSSAIHRPEGAGMRLHVSGGIENCVFDHQILHTVRSETSLESAGFSPADGYYDFTITGSAKSVTFATPSAHSDILPVRLEG